MNQWVRQFRMAAQAEARRALERYSEDDWSAQREAVTAAGAASEFMHAAVIAVVDPVLLADPRDLNSLIMLSRHNREWRLDPTKLRTAPMTRRIETVARLYPSTGIAHDATVISQMRNAAVHAAIADDVAEEAMLRLVRVVDVLEPLIPHWDLQFWPGGYGETLNQLRNEASSETQRLAQARIALARERFAELTFDLQDEALETMLRARERATSWSNADLERDLDCPACDRLGRMNYSVHTTYLPINGGLDVSAEEGVPSHFSCPVCGLDLPQELIQEFPELAGLIEIEQSAPDWGGTADELEEGDEQEPDEDVVRGR